MEGRQIQHSNISSSLASSVPIVANHLRTVEHVKNIAQLVSCLDLLSRH